MKLLMGKGRRRKLLAEAALPLSYYPSDGQIGLEPTTGDNRQLRPIKSAGVRSPKAADKKATVELPGVLTLHHLGIFLGAELNRHCRVPITHNLRPAEITDG